MMMNYAVWKSISEHTPAQQELFQSKRAKDFSFYLEIIGIIITIVANLWNASVDTTVTHWLKDKGLLDGPHKGFRDWLKVLMCQAHKEADENAPRATWEEADEAATRRIQERTASSVAVQRRRGLGGLHAAGEDDE